MAEFWRKSNKSPDVKLNGGEDSEDFIQHADFLRVQQSVLKVSQSG